MESGDESPHSKETSVVHVTMNRRQFLQRSILLGAAPALAQLQRTAVGAQPPLWPGEARRPAAGPLRVHSGNPRYFDDRSGKAIYLTGSHLGWELQDDAWGREHVFDYQGFLDTEF